MWQRYYPCKTIIFDKDKSCYLTVKALGGEYIHLSTGQNNSYKMNPLHWLKDSEKLPLIASWIIGLMTTFNNDSISSYQIDRLTHALKLLSSSVDSNLTLSNLKQMLDGIDKNLSSRLSPWVREEHGNFGFGYFFDNPIDTFYDNFSNNNTGIVCVDIGSILANEKIARPVIEYLMLCVDNFIDGKSPSFIYLEEAWYLLKDKRFSDQFENWIKTTYPAAQKTASGLYYVVERQGEGLQAVAGKTVSVHYSGKLMDGREFDNSYSRNEPIEFKLGIGQVIPGWDEGIALMKEGAKYKLIIPSELGYGKRGAGGVIPPNATLIFDTELMKVK
jgi:hypothetical protein